MFCLAVSCCLSVDKSCLGPESQRDAQAFVSLYGRPGVDWLDAALLIWLLDVAIFLHDSNKVRDWGLVDKGTFMLLLH